MKIQNTIESLEKKIKWYRVCSAVLVLSVVVVGLCFLKDEHDKNYVSEKYPLIDPAREFIPQENFIVNIQELREYLTDLGDKYPDSLSIYYEQVNSGANIVVNKDLKLYVASLIKLPIALVAMKKTETGEWNAGTKFPIIGQDVDQDSGNLYKNTMNFDLTNDTLTFDDLMRLLLVDSDNTAQNIFVRNLEQADFDEFENEIGLQDVFDDDGHASAKEYSRILRTLYTSSFLKRSNSQKILELLHESKFNNFLSSGVPEDIVFAHKYGENANEFIFADTGIVYVPGKPYMLTVIIKGKDVAPETIAWAKEVMKDVSTKAYEYSK